MVIVAVTEDLLIIVAATEGLLVIVAATEDLLVIVAATEHLLARGSQQYGVLVLGGVAAFDVAQWRVRIDDAHVAEILQTHQIFGLLEAVQPATAKRQCPEVIVYAAQKLLGFIQSEKYNTFKTTNTECNGADILR